MLVYRLNTGGEELGPVATAKYSGTFGNKLRVSVVAKDDKFEVTYRNLPVDLGATDIKSNNMTFRNWRVTITRIN